MDSGSEDPHRLPRWLLALIGWAERASGRLSAPVTLTLILCGGLGFTLALMRVVHGNAWVVGAAGLVVTLTLAHAFLMLISTRVRARDLARSMNEALTRSEARAHAIMDAAADAVVITDAQGCIGWCNQATRSIFGHEAEALRGQPLQIVLPRLGTDGLGSFFERHGIGKRVIGHESEGCRVDGTAFPVAVSASQAEFEEERWITFIVRDTTDAKWAEHELLLRDRALASSGNGVVISDMRLPNQPIIYVNPAFERITGYEAHEVLGMNCKLLQGADSDQPEIEQMREAIRERRPCRVVVRNYRKDGAMFWNELSISPVQAQDGTVTHYVGVQTDITERIAAEQAIMLRSERLNAVFDLSPDGFVGLDERDVVSIVNPAFERMTGLPAAELVGSKREQLEARLLARCSQHEQLSSETDEGAEAEPQDGMQELDRSTPLPSSSDVLHLSSPTQRTLLRRQRRGRHGDESVMYLRDITHELEVDRMKSEFLSMAAHELRTPMASIFGFTELMLRRKFDDERRQDMLATIHRQAGLLVNLVNELLDLARIEARRGKDFKRQVQRLQPLLQSTVDGLLVQNDPRKVTLRLPDEPVWVDADTEKLAQAVTNVLSNAYKYSPQGGAIELDLVRRERDGRAECGVRVIDHGLGMSPEHQARVFERFFRADTSGNIPGTGLGMTIVKEIVELHGGEVQVDSAPGAGTTVVLWLPTVPEPPQGEPADEFMTQHAG